MERRFLEPTRGCGTEQDPTRSGGRKSLDRVLHEDALGNWGDCCGVGQVSWCAFPFKTHRDFLGRGKNSTCVRPQNPVSGELTCPTFSWGLMSHGVCMEPVEGSVSGGPLKAKNKRGSTCSVALSGVPESWRRVVSRPGLDMFGPCLTSQSRHKAEACSVERNSPEVRPPKPKLTIRLFHVLPIWFS